MGRKRYSRKREMIYQKLVETNEHPSAEMLYQWLKPEIPDLSLGMVYRKLHLLEAEGLTAKFVKSDSQYCWHVSF